MSTFIDSGIESIRMMMQLHGGLPDESLAPASIADKRAREVVSRQ